MHIEQPIRINVKNQILVLLQYLYVSLSFLFTLHVQDQGKIREKDSVRLWNVYLNSLSPGCKFNKRSCALSNRCSSDNAGHNSKWSLLLKKVLNQGEFTTLRKKTCTTKFTLLEKGDFCGETKRNLRSIRALTGKNIYHLLKD